MSPRLPRLTAMTICTFVMAAFVAELVVTVVQHNQLERLAFSYYEVEQQQKEELDKAVAQVQELRKLQAKP